MILFESTSYLIMGEKSVGYLPPSHVVDRVDVEVHEGDHERGQVPSARLHLQNMQYVREVLSIFIRDNLNDREG